MPSWVLPSAAAELLGMSVEQILADVAAGLRPSRNERELLFVDIAISDDAMAEPKTTTPRRSLAWMPDPVAATVSPAERAALMNDDHEDFSNDDDEAPVIELSEDDQPDWGAVRARVALLRRPPARAAA